MSTRSPLRFIPTLILISGLLLAGCAPAAPAPTPQPTAPIAPASSRTAAAGGGGELILATTTSTRDSGLLDVLLPAFEQQTGIHVKMVAVGSGQAIQIGADGNADVLLVHSPAAEQDAMSKGVGKDRLLVMHNDFIIVGPKDDPAKIKGIAAAPDAFKQIANAQVAFVSRGDKSGTNSAELAIWKKAGITPSGSWYLQSGQGMGDTLRITSEKGGYTLSDRATYLAQQSTLALDVLVQGDPSLLNIYHVITVNPEQWPKVNYTGARIFADWLVSPTTQQIIAAFGKDKFGQSLFFPDAGKAEDMVGK